MNFQQENHSEASVYSEASDVEHQKEEDTTYIESLIREGIPVDIKNTYDEAVSLSNIVYDELHPLQVEAKAHIEKAIELFRTSYAESVAFVVEDANEILAKHPGAIRHEQGAVVGVVAIWKPSGEAILDFQIDQT
ncbi:MAG TPA: hypothetical protein VIM37_00895 [Candidatus Microsaccharimonas sp.]|jgi:hypothetical protein